MNAPFSHFLTRFSDAPPAPIAAAEPETPAEFVTLEVADLEGRLEQAAREARDAAEARHEAELAALDAAHRDALAQAVVEAQTLRFAQEGAAAAVLIEGAFAALRETLAEQASAALRPLLAEALVARARAAVVDALDRLLADADRPGIVVRGPAAFIAAVRAGRADGFAVEHVVDDAIDITIAAGATTIETVLGPALAALAGEA